MNIIFSSVSPTAPDNYIAEKLRACRKTPSSKQIEDINRNIGKTKLPLVAEADLPAFTQAQSSVIEINKKEVLNNLSYIVPLVPGETIEETSFSLLEKNYDAFSAGTPVLTTVSNFSTLDFIFNGYLLENGVLKKTAPSSPAANKDNALASTALGEDGDIIGDLIAKLAEAVAGDGLSWVVDKIASSIAAHFFQSSEVKELEKYVKKEIEENNIANANSRLHAVLSWICNKYSKNTSENELESQLTVLTESIMPVLPQYLAALPVYVVAVNTALLICRRIDELNPSKKEYAYYAPIYINEVTQLLRAAFDARAAYVQLQSYELGSGVQYYDNFNGTTGTPLKYSFCNPTSDELNAVTLQAEFAKLQYINGQVFTEFSTTYQTSIDSVQTWAKQNNQAIPRFTYGDRLLSITNEYIPLGGGLISGSGKYCLIYREPEFIQVGPQPWTTGGNLVIFSSADGKIVWQTNTYVVAGWRTYMQQDCNFVCYKNTPDGWSEPDANQLIWDPYPCPPDFTDDQYYSINSSGIFSSGTAKGDGPLDYFIQMQDDGNLVIYPTLNPDPSNSVWATHSNPTL